MNNNNSLRAGGGTDLLSSIMGVDVRNEEKIAAEDREFCEARQEKLHATLRQLGGWYGLLTTNAERYRESHNLNYTENGSVDTQRLRNFYHDESKEDYSAFEFLPFDAIDDVVKLYGKAVEAFARDVVRHFNRKYGVSVPMPEINYEKLLPGFMPTYQTYVDQVIEHLGDKGFRETAEEELIGRFHNIVDPGWHGKFKPELKGDKITFPDMVVFDNFYQGLNGTNHIHWNYRVRLSTVCEAIGFGAAGSVSGSVGSIIGFDDCNISTTEWYPFGIGDGVALKFFKNGRLDFKFENAVASERCWKRLRLDTFKTADGDE